MSEDGARLGAVTRLGQNAESAACGACVGALEWARTGDNAKSRAAPQPGDYQMDLVKATVVKHLPALDAAEGRDEIAVLCDLLCDDIRRDLLDAIAAADPGLPVYLLGGVQINADAKADNELLAVRHFEVRTAAGYVIDKFDALKECLNPGEILRSIR